MDKIKLLQDIINESDNIVFFGGAGVSTASGIRDFRGENGLYKDKYNYQPEYLLSSRCFYKDTSLFYDFYKNKMNCLDIKPNIAHLYLTKLEQRGKLKAVVTQNIDGLHQKAGTKNVLEIHGSIYRNYCINCNKEYSAFYVFNSKDIPKCECGGIIKPDVVLYGEMLDESFNLAQYYIASADTLIVAGTSLTVEPASSLISIFKGNNLIIINKDKTPYDNLATLVINDDLTKVFSKLK
jgi:NAD-dependent deacetylase